MLNFKKKYLIAILIIVICFVSACQATPDENVVNQRDYKALLKTASKDFVLEYPDRYTNSFVSKDKKVNITIDADIIVSDAEKYPVIQIDPKPFTDEMIQLAVNTFMEGDIGYYPEKSMTKSQVEAEIIKLQARINDVDGLYEKYKDEAQVSAVINNLKQRVNRYTEMLANAPENKELISAEYNFRPYDFYSTDDYNYITTELNMTQEELNTREQNPNEPLYLISDTDLSNGEYIRMFVYNEPAAKIGQPHNFGMHCMEHYEVQIVRGHAPFAEKFDYISSADPYGDILENGSLDEGYPKLTISLEEAENMALDAMHNLGLDNYYLAYSEVRKQSATYEETVAFWEVVMNNPDAEVEDMHEDKEDKFYMLTFKPIYYGIPYVNANNRFSQEMPANVLFAFEEVKVRVANDSIAEFRWINPTDVSKTINDNVRLLNFDEIIKIAENHMKLKYSIETVANIPLEIEDYEERLANYISADININKIQLGLGGVKAYNSADEYMIIPVWNFYGSYKYDRTDDMWEDENSYELMPLVSINAVDGSIIDQCGWEN